MRVLAAAAATLLALRRDGTADPLDGPGITDPEERDEGSESRHTIWWVVVGFVGVNAVTKVAGPSKAASPAQRWSRGRLSRAR